VLTGKVRTWFPLISWGTLTQPIILLQTGRFEYGVVITRTSASEDRGWCHGE
jgi:hypothetical protein